MAGSTSLVEEVNRLLRCWGQAIDPHTAWLVDRGLRTLAVRMERHNANGLAVAQWAESNPASSGSTTRDWPRHPDHALAAPLLSGFGGMVGLELKGGLRAAERMLRRLKLVAHAPSLAGVESLVSEPRFTSHRNLSSERARLDGHPGRLPAAELRTGGRRRHHRRPGPSRGRGRNSVSGERKA